jgi:hypothetical protein
MPAHKIYTASEYRAIKAARSREWRKRNQGRASPCTKLMRWYDRLRNIDKLRIVLNALDVSADEMLEWIETSRKMVDARNEKR